MNLGDKVHVVLEVTGEVVGRTFENDPKIDLKLPWGMLNGLPISVLKQADSVDDTQEAPPENVTQIRPIVQKNKKIVRAAG
jgi:hypothetical protein